MVKMPGFLSLLRDRINFSTLTKIYFAFSLIHFVVQVTIQIRAFTINDRAEQTLSALVSGAQERGRPFLQGSTLRMCYWVNSNLDVDIDTCPIVWQARTNPADVKDSQSSATSNSADYALSGPTSAPATSLVPSTSRRPDTPAPTRTVETITTIIRINPIQTSPPLFGIDNDNDGDIDSDFGGGFDEGADNEGDYDDADDQESDAGDDDADDNDDDERSRPATIVKRQSLPQNWNSTANLNVTFDDKQVSASCLWTIQYPLSILRNTKREDIAFIGFHLWVLGMSIVALLNESMPHVLASLVTHAMATAWAGFQISHTATFRANYNRVVANGACSGFALLPDYWRDRRNAELSSLALNILALVLSGFLTWKLIKLFGWQTFKRVGASRKINRIYKLVLTLSITLQLSLFFMIVTVSLWIDQLFNDMIGDVSVWIKLNKAFSFITLVLLIPWLMTGWFAARRELRIPMFAFLALSILYLGGWGLMFFSTTFRWTFLTWRFFSVMASASVALTFTSAFLGVVCFFNFGHGLARYLSAHRELPEDNDEYGYAAEKGRGETVAFPITDSQPIPTYFSSGYYGHRQSSSADSSVFDYNGKQADSPLVSVAVPERAITVALPSMHGDNRNYLGMGSNGSVTRSNSSGSSKSSASYASNDSKHSRNGSQTSHTKRWIIE